MGSSPPPLAMALAPLSCSWLCLCPPSLAALFVSPDCADFRLEPDPLSSFVVSWPVVGCCAPPAWEDSGGWWPTVGDSATMLHNTVYVQSYYTVKLTVEPQKIQFFPTHTYMYTQHFLLGLSVNQNVHLYQHNQTSPIQCSVFCVHIQVYHDMQSIPGVL